MHIQRALRVVTVLGCVLLPACAAHPVRVSCGNHLAPINVQSGAAPVRGGTGASPLSRRSDTHSAPELTRGR